MESMLMSQSSGPRESEMIGAKHPSFCANHSWGMLSATGYRDWVLLLTTEIWPELFTPIANHSSISANQLMIEYQGLCTVYLYYISYLAIDSPIHGKAS